MRFNLRLFIAYCLPGFIALVLVTTMGQNAVSYLSDRWGSKIESQSIELGQTEKVKGVAYIRGPEEKKWNEIKKGTKIHHRDIVKVNPRSSWVLKLNGGYSIELTEKSQAIIESWNPLDAQSSPIYIHLLMGDYRIIQPGKRGSLYLSSNKKLFDPAFPPQVESREIVIKKGFPKVEAPAEEEERAPSSEPSPNGQRKIFKPNPSALRSIPQLKTLTNAHIDEIIGKQSQHFRRCQTNSIRESGDGTGQALVGFTIIKDGTVDEARVLQTNIEDQRFLRCLMSVVKRSKFDAFLGQSIHRSIPLVFE